MKLTNYCRLTEGDTQTKTPYDYYIHWLKINGLNPKKCVLSTAGLEIVGDVAITPLFFVDNKSPVKITKLDGHLVINMPINKFDWFPTEITGNLELKNQEIFPDMRDCTIQRSISIDNLLNYKMLSKLPSTTIKELHISQCNIRSFKVIPPNVETLILNNCGINNFQDFPKNTHNMIIRYNNSITMLSGLQDCTFDKLVLNTLELESFKDSPQKINNLDITSTKITTLQGLPEIISGTVVLNLPNLANFIGGPKEVGSLIICSHAVVSLESIPKIINGDCSIQLCPSITSLKDINKYITKLSGNLSISENVTSHLMGVLFIPGITKIFCPYVYNSPLLPAIEIINKCLSGQISRIICQKELINAGLGEFARM